ncbi:phage distal tail protein domain-containing protein [Lactococcus fujiensis]|uniref:Uncharacterized protein n=1 Tax=Lactococcus fujiensis JCM 16395 TaxID=1291764 RepID=A0A2A5RIA0_9LACT|nr:phage distal tail protein domain-containing protein [Lactococcus fujiensis]PCR98857.1 hypothetical protein RT41_GL000641 [Lactococcus fujiensis JCM 16395]
MTVRQFKIHTDLDSESDEVIDVTNGLIRFYEPSNLGMSVSNNIWQSDGIGVKGYSETNQPSISFKLITLANTRSDNYALIRDFIQKIISFEFVTLEYTTDIFTVYADVAISEQTKTEGYGRNGQFEETIAFDCITKWYTYEKLEFGSVSNGSVVEGLSKIYSGTDMGYHYSSKPEYTYFGETNVDRLNRGEFTSNTFGITAKLIPTLSTGVDNGGSFGISFANQDFNEYTAIVFTMSKTPNYIQLNTDVNDEYYLADFDGSGTGVNVFTSLDFQRYRSRLFQKGAVSLINCDSVEINIKRKVDFI